MFMVFLLLPLRKIGYTLGTIMKSTKKGFVSKQLAPANNPFPIAEKGNQIDNRRKQEKDSGIEDYP
jgi:hypothetical protein